jgi:hypothetical protein
MADKNTAALSADIAKAYDVYMAELKQAGPTWDRKPAGAKEGEAAWCAREVAEHIAGAAGFFASGIARAINATAAAPQRHSLADANAAVAAMPGIQAALLEVVSQVPDGQLSPELEFGPLGKTSLGGVLGILAHHYGDHANQLKTLRGG